ncbi:hypothetical protein L3X38_041672 [Prunus dulcis]|uniref:Integrase catalytic domain-containing protein n=1 Tax=Prunus dulcis TaxID=3755 RepID=A0AAD4UUU1_PRUDU|nr:hypothetical protein L3X38_041672 [Prunus dulcis]
MKRNCDRYKRWLDKQKAKGKNQVHVCFESNAIEISSYSWWLDSGASVHVANSLQRFKTKRLPSKAEMKVFVGNGERVKVEYIGLARIELESGFILELVDVVYIPSMKRDLISFSKLVKSNLQFEFDESGFSIFRNKVMIGNGFLNYGMFGLNCKKPNPSTGNLSINVISTKRKAEKEESYKLWHKRLGHVSATRMNLLNKENLLPPLNHHDKDSVCIECVKGKLTNLRKKGATRSEKVLEIIHIDICGPFPTQTHDGFKYFITFTDDYSRYGYVYLISEKSNALDMFKVYKAEVDNQLDSKIKVVRSDRGGEFYGKFDERGRNPGPFAKFLQEEDEIESDNEENFDFDEILENKEPAEKENMLRDITILPFTDLNDKQVSPNHDLTTEVPQIALEDMQIEQQEPQPHNLELRRSQRTKRPALSNDFFVYLQESEHDINTTDDPLSYKQAI